MKKEIAELWVKALRSGEYEQARGKLRVTRDSGDAFYCCLGVLCDLYRVQTGLGEWSVAESLAGNRHVYFSDTSIPGWYCTSASDLVTSVVNWAGCKSHTGEFRDEAGRRYLIELNDIEKKTFLEIADVIEKHWEAL